MRLCLSERLSERRSVNKLTDLASGGRAVLRSTFFFFQVLVAASLRVNGSVV